MTFNKHRSCLNKKGELVADDGTKLSVNDHVYLVCEPPGDPYYLCRIMEFLHVEADNPNSPIDSLRVNWYYRPRDVQRFSSDTRLLFGTMHSDMCPLTSLRGKCTIKHRSEIEDLEAYRKERDSFYFVQVFDRFIRRSYECIPVQQIINVPDKVKKALNERWKFVVVEIGRVKELTSAAKTCKRCARFCATTDSVDCAICKNSYHMNCVQPPLPKKPSRGFAWACAPCSRASEKKMEARNTPTASGHVTEAEEEDVVEEEVPAASNDTTRAPSPGGDDMVVDDHPATQAEIALAKMWPMRYLGIHARVEDALQYDDRAIYPRASSRLGPRHQANTNMWHGRPVELVKPAEIKKRYNKGASGKKEGKLTKETVAAMEADREEKAKRPKWVQDEPTGYVARGEDYPNDDPRCTAKLMFKMPSIQEHPKAMRGDDPDPAQRQEKYIQDYVTRAKALSRQVGVPPFGTNFLDKALELLTAEKYDQDRALKKLSKVDRVKDLHEPVLSKSDLIKFEEGVAKYGSEHRLIRLHMKTNLPNSDIVRFYYLWKKTPKGREIWGNYGGRKKRKAESDTGARLQAEVANDGDDSAFDNDKAARKGRGFQCKFCSTQYSRQWKRAPGVAPGQTALAEGKGSGKDKKERPFLALCLRCAGLWRKYGIQWEEIDEVTRKVAQSGGKGLKRRMDEELLRELIAANDAANLLPPEQAVASVPSIEGGEPPKKKSKTEKAAQQIPVAPPKPEKPPPPPKEPTPPPPPIVPNQPTWKALPCAICKGIEDTIGCTHCKLTVHRKCFGVGEFDGVRANGETHWVCEQCQNDKNPQVSTDYACCLCLKEETQVDLVEPPKISHKKKTDREREKERLEKELADSLRTEYRARQIAHNRPVLPREPLKRTTGNNWVHVQCAMWMPEVKFSSASALEVAEGIQSIAQRRFEEVCKFCKNKDHQGRVRSNAGACADCFQCGTSFHVSCALDAGCTFGFDVTPVKNSRKDQVPTATLGSETGAVQAIMLCKEHVPKNPLHPINEVVDENGTTALQVFAEKYKQADLALTGTVRKAAQAQLTKEKGLPATDKNGSRRESGAHSIAAAVRRGARNSTVAELKAEATNGSSDGESDTHQRRCVKCDVDVTPKWHPIVKEEPPKSPRDQNAMTLGEIADLNKPSEPPASRPSEAPKPQHIRFMAPGANGRAWEGMPERYGPRPTPSGDRSSSDVGVPVGTPVRDPLAPPTEVNGAGDEVFHNHALPQYQNPAARLSPPRGEKQHAQNMQPQEWLCHKCFLKRKLDPTPPPEEKPSRMTLSPPRQFPLILDNTNRSPQPSAPPTIEQQFELWDRPPQRQTPAPPPPPPPMMNGLGPPAPHYGPTGPPHGYPPPPHFGQQPNGYHNGPHPQHGGPPPPHLGGHSMHERHHSHGGFGFGHASPHMPFSQPSHAPPSHHRPPTLNGFGPPVHGNGLPSPHTSAPPLHSPTYGPHMSHHQPLPGPRPEPGFATQLQPLGTPMHSRDHAGFGRPPSQPFVESASRPRTQPPPNAQPAVSNGHPHSTPQPHAGSPVPGSEQPSTPRVGNGAFGPNPSGASASPNLMNLLH